MTDEQSTSLELLLDILNVVHCVMEESQDVLSELELEPKALFLLSILDDNPEPAQLAKALLLPRPTVTFLVKKLESLGYIARATNSKDLRRYKLSMTKSGRKAMERGRTALSAAFNSRLKKLPAKDETALRAIVTRLQ